MRRFYTRMRSGRPGAEALRDAKPGILRGPASRHAPFHCAGVVRTGDALVGLPAF